MKVTKEKKSRGRNKLAPKKTKVVYQGADGNVLSDDLVANITRFQVRFCELLHFYILQFLITLIYYSFQHKHTGHIDVYWLYDDGGLTLLLPYILTTR